MPDGYGSDPFMRNIFLHQAMEGPSGQELATMTAPFGGSVEQARSLYQNPQFQQLLGHFGMQGFNPDQIRQSPFLPNAFMHQHPLLGGALSGAMANMAATPEAPMVSGAGSGITRAMQGIMGGPELQRQYQVRQLMAPFQAMGMQLPVMAEQRRQELLKNIQDDMQQRRQYEEKTQPDLINIKQQLAEAATVRAQAAEEQAKAAQQRSQTPKITPFGVAYPGGGTEITHPSGMPAELGGQVLPGGPGRFEPFGQDAINAQLAMHPERQSAADWKQALMDAGVPEAEADRYAAMAMQARQRSQGGKDSAYWDKAYRDMDDKISEKIRNLEMAIQDPKATEEQKNQYRINIDQLNQQREQEKARMDRDRGAPGTSKPYNPSPQYNPGGQSGVVNPGAKSGAKGAPAPQSQGQVQSQPQSQGTSTGLPEGYVFNELGIPVRAQASTPTTSGPQQ